MIVLDTCAMIFDALTPERISAKTKKNINAAQRKNSLVCSDISLWEIGMLIQKKRLIVETDTLNFLRILLDARNIEVLGISIEIADIATKLATDHLDPADRIIASTALHHNADLITCDKKLQSIPGLSTIW